MEYLFGIIILLGALVFFHELGHFLVAKYFGVKVEVFSLGFGTKLIQKKIGETQYCISLIPLGGYVKLYGEDPTSKIKGPDASRSFANQSVWRRIGIAAAGPTANIVLAILVFVCIEMFGLEKVITGHLAFVQKGSQAWELGLRPGDEITHVNGKELVRWQQDFLGVVQKSVDQKVHLTVQRQKQSLDVEFIPQLEAQWNMFCEKPEVGVLQGVSVMGANTRVGLSDPDSIAAQAGFETGDLILSLNNISVKYWYELENYLLNIAQKELVFEVEREGKAQKIQLKLLPEYFLLSEKQKQRLLGLFPYELFLREDVAPDTAAYRAGLQSGDRLVSMNDEPLQSWDQMTEMIQKSGKEKGQFYLTYERAGDLTTVQVFPTKLAEKHPCGVEEESYKLGILSNMSDIYQPPKVKPYQELNPIKALSSASVKSVGMMLMIFKSVGKMITGQIPLKPMGGPILIGKIAGDQFKEGVFPFLVLLAMISLNLAVLNFLPIPVLDGGHLLLFARSEE